MWLGSRGWAVVLAAASLAGSGHALAASGSDVRACYRFSDSLPPLDADAPAVDFTDISQTGSPLELGDDSLSEVPIGFGFEFYRREFKTVWIASNGFITFLAENESGCCEGQRVPDGLRPNGLIAGLWKDLYLAGSGVAYQTLGTAPNRRFVAQFTAVLENVDGPGGFPATFQIVLFEGSHEIRVVYESAESGTKVASAGLEDLTGAFGLLWRHGAFSLSNASVRYLLLDTDSDGDGVVDCIDTCRLAPDAQQADADGDGTGDACDLDTAPVGLAQQPPRSDTSPSAAPDADHGALVVWDGATPAANQAIVARRVGPDGMPDGLPFQVSAETAPAHFDPRIASAPGGGFVVAWHRQLAPAGAPPQDTMRNRRIGGDGVLGVERDVLLVDPFSDVPSAGMFPSGRGLVAAATGNGGIVAQLTDPAGEEILDEVPVGLFPPSAESDIAVTPGGEALVVWRGTSVVLDTHAINARRVDDAGNLLGGELPISPVLSDNQRGPRAAAAVTGGFVVTWSGYDAAGASRVFAQRLAQNGENVGAQVQVFTAEGGAANSAVAADAVGNFLVVWQENTAIRAQRLHPDGRLLGGSFPVRFPARGSFAAVPAVAMTSTGDAVVAWREEVSNASLQLPVAIAARRLSPCGNGNIDPGETCDDGNRTPGDCCSPLCQLEPDGQVCDDGFLCTVGETCSQGACGDGGARECSDGIACTADRCDPEAGCLHDPAPAGSSACDDVNPCTTDRCDVSVGCVHDGAPFEGQACDDGSACTEADTCGAGACGGRPLACDDGDACTADSCDAALGCVHSAPGADGAACDDGDDCTAEDVCGGGTCGGARFCGPGVPPGSELPAKQGGTVKLPCIGGAGSRCTAELFAEAPAQSGQSRALAGVGQADQIVNPVRISKRVRARKLKRRGRVVLTIKLTGAGRRLVAGSPGGRLQVLARTTVTARGEAPRSSGILLFLRARGARGR